MFKLVALLVIGLATTAAAGTFFRLEIGPPAAAGFESKGPVFKNAVLVVRPLLCEPIASLRIRGTAEGVVNGRRQSIALNLVPLGKDGIHAVPREWPDSGQWVLHLSATCANAAAGASTLVPMTKTGFNRSSVQVLREAATPAQVERALAAFLRAES